MRYIKKVFGILSTISFTIIIIYGLVHAPKLFGLKMMNIEKDNNAYFKNSLAYYYVVDAKNISAGDAVIFKKNNEVMVGSVYGISGNDFKIKTNNSEEVVSFSDIVGKNINIYIRYLAPFVIFINNNLFLSFFVLVSFIIISIVLNIFYEKNIKEDIKVNDNINNYENNNVSNNMNNVEQNKKHKKVLEIDE